MKQKNPRKIDKDFRESRSWLSKKMTLVKKSKIVNLKNLIIVAFIAGAIISTIWIVDTNRQTQSKAASGGETYCTNITNNGRGECWYASNTAGPYLACNKDGDGSGSVGSNYCVGNCCVPKEQTKICGNGEHVLKDGGCCSDMECNGYECNSSYHECSFVKCASGYAMCNDSSKCVDEKSGCCGNDDCSYPLGTCKNGSCICKASSSMGCQENDGSYTSCNQCCTKKQCSNGDECVNHACVPGIKDCTQLDDKGKCLACSAGKELCFHKSDKGECVSTGSCCSSDSDLIYYKGFCYLPKIMCRGGRSMLWGEKCGCLPDQVESNGGCYRGANDRCYGQKCCKITFGIVPIVCNDKCINMDENNCGICGNKCSRNQICEIKGSSDWESKCRDCDLGSIRCGGKCRTILSPKDLAWCAINPKTCIDLLTGPIRSAIFCSLAGVKVGPITLSVIGRSCTFDFECMSRKCNNGKCAAN